MLLVKKTSVMDIGFVRINGRSSFVKNHFMMLLMLLRIRNIKKTKKIVERSFIMRNSPIISKELKNLNVL